MTNLDETNLKKIEDKFDALEKEASQRERNERLKKKKCVDYLQQNKLNSVNHLQIIRDNRKF